SCLTWTRRSRPSPNGSLPLRVSSSTSGRGGSRPRSWPRLFHPRPTASLIKMAEAPRLYRPRERDTRPEWGDGEGRPVDLTAELNPEQAAAALYADGPLLIVAGAGTGKTRTLVYRVAHLLETGVAPER